MNNSWMTAWFKGDTKVIATIKAEIDVPDADRPNHGKLDFFVDW